CMQGLEFPYTF
nr:immunoglobulin light chain junction region [Macaca mulatta]MOV35068.1 immunoglobulin light chain junction region [Macaca mulatta]MOV37523.1 immunoglobulin light chain junction region [Macaca mulatta]MOV37607.1 immunoglobulin light chain junction region [Macaca mulatta]MOV60931.1 immunoglobulin light chain junction region [Macaca mulatta]